MADDTIVTSTTSRPPNKPVNPLSQNKFLGTKFKWSKENCAQERAEFKEKLKLHVSNFRTLTKPNDNSRLKRSLMDICDIIAQPAEKQYQTLDDDEAQYYESILDVTLDLDIHIIMFDALKSCESNPSSGLRCETIPDWSLAHDLVSESHCELFRVCFECLAHIASGSKAHTDAVKNLGLQRYAEALALQRSHITLSLMAFKLLVCFISEDAQYGDDICQRISYHRRATELFIADDVTFEWKSWLVFFWDWAMHSCSGDPKKMPKWVVHRCLSAACVQLQKCDLMSEDKSIGLIKTLIKKRFIHRIDQYCICITNTLILYLIPVLVSKLSHSNSAIVSEVLLVLGNIFQSDRHHYYRNSHKAKLATVAVENGLFNQLVMLCHSDLPGVIEKVMWLLSIVVSNEEAHVINVEAAYVFIPSICFFLRSTDYLVASRALFAIYYFLCADDLVVMAFIKRYHQLLPSVTALLGNLNTLEQSGKTQNLSSEENPLITLFDFGVCCLDVFVDLELLHFDGADNHSNNYIAKTCSEPAFLCVLIQLKRLDLTMYEEGQNLKFRLQDTLRKTAELFRKCDIKVTDKTFSDLFEENEEEIG